SSGVSRSPARTAAWQASGSGPFRRAESTASHVSPGASRMGSAWFDSTQLRPRFFYSLALQEPDHQVVCYLQRRGCPPELAWLLLPLWVLELEGLGSHYRVEEFPEDRLQLLPLPVKVVGDTRAPEQEPERVFAVHRSNQVGERVRHHLRVADEGSS